MIVTQTDNAFAFSFETIAEVIAYNEWLETIDLHHAKVLIPFGMNQRKFRRAITKCPSILRADNEHSIATIRERWM